MLSLRVRPALIGAVMALCLFVPRLCRAGDSEFIWDIVPCEIYSYDSTGTHPQLMGVGKLYLSINSSKGEVSGIRRSNPPRKDGKMDLYFMEFSIASHQEHFKGSCAFEGVDDFTGNKVTGAFRYADALSIRDFGITIWSEEHPGQPWRYFRPLESAAGRQFRQTYLRLINIED